MFKLKNIFFSFIFPSLAFLVFFASLDAPFYLDDFDSIINNAIVNQIPSWEAIAHTFPFRQITYYSFSIQLNFFGDSPVSFRIFNIALHALNSFLTFVFVQQLLRLMQPDIEQEKLRNCALFTAIVFLVLPLNTQSVIYIVQRGVLLAYLFFMLASIVYIKLRFLDNDNKLKIFYFLIFIGAMLCGFMSKQNFASIFIAIFIFEICLEKGLLWGRFPQVFLFAGVGFMTLTLADFLFGLGIIDTYSNFANPGIVNMSHWAYFSHQISILWIYIYKFFVPYPLLLEYEPILNGWSDSITWLAFFGHILLLISVVRVKDRHPIVPLAVMLYFGLHLIESGGIIVLDDLAFEHRTYLPNFALVLLSTYVIVTARVKGQKLVLVGAALVLVFSLISYQRADLWNNKLEFYRNELTHTHNNPRAYSAVGLYYADKGKLPKAEKWMLMSLQVSNEIGLVEAGTITSYLRLLYEQGKIAQASRFASFALKETRHGIIKARILMVMAEQKMKQGYCPMALNMLERAKAIEPQNRVIGVMQDLCKNENLVD